jgi:holo-[acyl-carrier protein] synthase
MIHGIGTDIVQIDRIARIYERHGERLVRHILMDAEAQAFEKQPRAARFLAMRFAAKEAIVKAMGTGFGEGIWLRDVGITKNPLGKPEVVWSDRGTALCEKLGIGESHITLSDDHGLAIAMVVLMRR